MGRMDRLSRDDNDSNSDQRAGAGSAPPEARRQAVEGTQSGGAGDPDPENKNMGGAVKERWERRPLQRRDSDVEFVSEGETQVALELLNPLEHMVVRFLQRCEKKAAEREEVAASQNNDLEAAHNPLEGPPLKPLTPAQQRHAKYIWRRAIGISMLVGSLAAMAPCQGTAANNLCGEDDATMDYMIMSGIIGTVASVIELGIMYFEGARSIGELARVVGVRLQLSAPWSEAKGALNSRAKFLTASLAHQAMELPPPIDPILGVRPLCETSPTLSKLQYYSYGAGRGVVVFLMRVLLKRVVTRAAVRGASAYNDIGWIAVPVIAIWNALMMMTVIGGAKAIMVGPLVVGNLTPDLFAYMNEKANKGKMKTKASEDTLPPPELRVPLARAAGVTIVSDKQFHSSMFIMLGFCRRNLLEADADWLEQAYGVRVAKQGGIKRRRSMISKMLKSEIALEVAEEHKQLCHLNLDSRWIFFKHDLGENSELTEEQKDSVLAMLVLSLIVGTHPSYRQRRMFRTAMECAGRSKASARHGLGLVVALQQKMWETQDLSVPDLYACISFADPPPPGPTIGNCLDSFMEDICCGVIWCGEGVTNKFGKKPRGGFDPTRSQDEATALVVIPPGREALFDSNSRPRGISLDETSETLKMMKPGEGSHSVSRGKPLPKRQSPQTVRPTVKKGLPKGNSNASNMSADDVSGASTQL